MYPFINKKSSLQTETGLSIYKYIIRPALTYACPVWGGTAQTNLHKLQVIQNKVLRRIINAPWFITNDQIHKELQIDPLKKWIERLSERFFTSLPSCPSTGIFNLGASSLPFPRIRSRHSKDLLQPP